MRITIRRRKEERKMVKMVKILEKEVGTVGYGLMGLSIYSFLLLLPLPSSVFPSSSSSSPLLEKNLFINEYSVRRIQVLHGAQSRAPKSKPLPP